MIDRNSAPDGEEYFAMALLFAANRWGNASGIYDYDTEANAILDAMVNKTPTSTVVPMINPAANQIVFTPDANSEAYTDPSYHVPAFYELFSRWGTQDNAYWQTVAETSRAFFPKAAHPVTGLYSDYSEFDGTPKVTSFNENSHLSAFDSIRTIQNIAVDYAWFEDDYSAVELSNRILSFYDSQPSYVTVYTHDGVPQVDYRIEAHVAMNAVAALAADIPEAKRFVQDLWDMPVPTGEWRYYNGLLYMLGLLHTSGEFKIYAPGSVEPSAPLAFTQSLETTKETPITVTLEGSDRDGQVTSYQITQSPMHGQLNGSGNSLEYSPTTGFVGSDTFQFTVTDNDGLVSNPATVSISVIEDQAPSGGLVCDVTENLWNSGYTARVTVTNDSPAAVNAWQVSIALAPGDVVSQSWNSTLSGTTGIITAENIGWNANLDVGESASFGFKASHTGLNGRPAVSCQ
jgi:endo-1,4-beta-D-glucanase Y